MTTTGASYHVKTRKVPSRATQHHRYRVALILTDTLALMGAFLVAYGLRFNVQLTLAPEVAPSFVFYVRLMALLIPLWLGLFACFGLYDFRYLLGGTAEYSRAFNACSSGVILVVLVSFLIPEFSIARGWLIMAWLLAALFVCLARFALRRTAYLLREQGFFITPALIVGANEEGLALAQQFGDVRASGVRVAGFVVCDGCGELEEVSMRDSRVLGTLSQLPEIARNYEVEEIVVAPTALTRDQLIGLFETLEGMRGIELRLSSGLFEVFTTGMQIRTMGFVPLMSLNRLRLDPIEMTLKTFMDYLLTIAGVVALLPFFAVISLLIRLDSAGPILHRRRVLGMEGKEFDAFKFRTMVVNGDEILAARPDLQQALAEEHKLKDDPRITAVGHWLRRYSLDELPQLFNVLLGQMSLVGPRMISPAEGAKYGRLRSNLLSVKPGLTGLWQVSGRSDVSYEERVRLDMYYIRNYTIWMDLQILFFQTLPAVWKGRGAY